MAPLLSLPAQTIHLLLVPDNQNYLFNDTPLPHFQSFSITLFRDIPSKTSIILKANYITWKHWRKNIPMIQSNTDATSNCFLLSLCK